MPLPVDTLLGRTVEHEPAYSPQLLTPIPRAPSRQALALGTALPFVGVDHWTGWELGWLDPDGRPRVAVLECAVPADSPQLIESKSLKLYLNSYARERLPDHAAVGARIAADLSLAAGAAVAVRLIEPGDWARLTPTELPGECIDSAPWEDSACAGIESTALAADPAHRVAETLHSHLLRSNCPVTGQPDWASLLIAYRGPRIERTGLLRYLVSFRGVREFHEQCVERIWLDLDARCAPSQLCVQARYTRRGGLDINPLRASPGMDLGAARRHWRQ